MKISKNWLQEWIKIKISKKILKKITNIGIEVRKIAPFYKKKNFLSIGKIISYKKIQNSYAGKEFLIDIGKNFFLVVLSKEKDLKKNTFVVVSYFQDEKNEKKKIGKFCYFSDFIKNERKKIITIQEKSFLGKDFKKYMMLNDSIIHFSTLPNRPDFNSLIGIARELSFYTKKKLKNKIYKKFNPTFEYPIKFKKKIKSSSFYHCSLVIKNLDTKKKTPLWMKIKLLKSGIQTKNAIIDVLNYIFLELGQPINFFDFQMIGKLVVIRNSKENEEFYYENKKKIFLKKNTIVLSNQKSIFSIVGIRKNQIFSKVSKDIFLETTILPIEFIKKNLKNHHLNQFYKSHTKGIDIKTQKFALKKAAYFIASICKGRCSEIFEYSSEPKTEKKIVLHEKKIKKVLGFRISRKIVKKILQKIGFLVKEKKENFCVFSPTWRFDIKYEEDLIEEIIKNFNHNKFFLEEKKFYENKKFENNYLLEQDIKKILIARGYYEIISYSFVDSSLQSLLFPKKKFIFLKNPISNNMSVLRASLQIGLISTCLYNINRKNNSVRFFEFGKVFFYKDNNYCKKKIIQENFLSGISTKEEFLHWKDKKNYLDFYDIKGDLEAIFFYLDIHDRVAFKKTNTPFLNKKCSSDIFLNEKNIGFVGFLKKEIRQKIKLKKEIFLFEIFWDKIPNKKHKKFRNFSKYPFSIRDISMIIKQNITFGKILKECKKIKQKENVEFSLIDVYIGENIPIGYKSYTISLKIQGMFHTINEKETEKIVKKYTTMLEKKFLAKIR
ncbi:phenylalanine--tRNA ligase subunit beta [bacterium endosymbiont of Pedicinus badii]|uniref:phenylalanine--tRNA ligase subunit beta n=1 Tax=bacterium endosymbiont of Pedicinus badii TaxID=1719126 RepID=UPI0009B9BA91|nr:phenylalanine--tRNA ligase subunit beta [bacterium endosymbiont of Pedicinus badii]OQM34388.1 hypothetical protein AOQ89_00665 [bacterium endosymbiont of Pedicinus badii]